MGVGWGWGGVGEPHTFYPTAQTPPSDVSAFVSACLPYLCYSCHLIVSCDLGFLFFGLAFGLSGL